MLVCLTLRPTNFPCCIMDHTWLLIPMHICYWQTTCNTVCPISQGETKWVLSFSAKWKIAKSQGWWTSNTSLWPIWKHFVCQASRSSEQETNLSNIDCVTLCPSELSDSSWLRARVEPPNRKRLRLTITFINELFPAQPRSFNAIICNVLECHCVDVYICYAVYVFVS